jgi:hypothetical protein
MIFFEIALHRLVCIIVFAVACLTGISARAEELSGRQAEEYIQGFAEKYTGRQYSALFLERRNRSPRTGGMVDAVVFTPFPAENGNNKYHFIRRLDDDYVVRLQSAQGKAPELVVSRDILRYQKVIKDNELSPFVVLDKGGTEVMVVYCGLRPCSISWNRRQNGEILLEVYETFKNREAREDEFFLELPAS